MSRTFNDSLEEDLDRVFFNTSEFATTVSIQRGLHITPNVAAIRTNKSYDVTDEEGEVGTSYLSVAFSIKKTAYRICGVEVDPRPCDLLVLTDGTYEVLPVPGRNCFEPSDSGMVLTVHTKRI